MCEALDTGIYNTLSHFLDGFEPGLNMGVDTTPTRLADALSILKAQNLRAAFKLNKPFKMLSDGKISNFSSVGC